MATRTRFVSIVTVALVLLWSSYVGAGVLTIDFPADLANYPACRTICRNTTADGFRISPSAHYDTVVFTPLGEPPQFNVPGIGWDGTFGPNPDYLGPPVHIAQQALYVDLDGLPFSLLSLESLGEPFDAESSNNVIVHVPGPSFPPLPAPIHFDFVGPE